MTVFLNSIEAQEFYDIMNAQWLEDEEQQLYFVANDEVFGANDNVIEQILDTLMLSGDSVLSTSEIHSLGLYEVDQCLKRYSPEDGYYHA